MLKAHEIPMSVYSPDEVSHVAEIAMMRVVAKRQAVEIKSQADAEFGARLFGTWMRGRASVRMLGSRRVERREEMRRLLKARSYREVMSAMARIKDLDRSIAEMREEMLAIASDCRIYSSLIN